MEKIFEQYGGVIITVIAIIALIALVTFFVSKDGAVNKAFNSAVTTMTDKLSSTFPVN